MSKVESSETFTISAPVDRVWAYFKELKNIAYCIPGCEEVSDLGPQGVKLKIKFKLGYASKSLVVDVSVVDSRQCELLTFKGSSEDARMFGSLNFQKNGDETLLKYTLSVEAASPMARTALTFMGKDFVRKQTQLFADCVRQKITTA